MDTKDELDLITRIRGEVMGKREHTGENLFLAWGYPTAIFLLLEFLALMLWHENWCTWIWTGIPLVGAPLMVYFLKKDYDRTGNRTLDQNGILQMWIYIGFLSFMGGLTMGFTGVFEQFYATFQAVLISLGCFMTGTILQYRPKKVCGIIGTVLSFLSLFFQGDLWPWQLMVAVIVTVVTLIVPGHLFRRYVRSQDAQRSARM